MHTQEIIDSAIGIIRSQSQDPDRVPVTAAHVGLLLRRSFGKPVWKEAGYPTLKLFLQELERRGVLRIGETDRGALAVQLGDSGDFHLSPPTAQPDGRDLAGRPLMKPYWIAFALGVPKGRRFIKPDTAELMVAKGEDFHADEGWIEVSPIDADEQRGWARQFLEEKNIDASGSVGKALESDEWYLEFPKELRSIRWSLAGEWNRERSRHVALHVTNWCKENGIPIQSAFQSPLRKFKNSKKRSAKSGLRESYDDEPAVRQLVLGALESASTDWLLELPIPMKYVIRALKNSPGRS